MQWECVGRIKVEKTRREGEILCHLTAYESRMRKTLDEPLLTRQDHGVPPQVIEQGAPQGRRKPENASAKAKKQHGCAQLNTGTPEHVCEQAMAEGRKFANTQRSVFAGPLSPRKRRRNKDVALSEAQTQHSTRQNALTNAGVRHGQAGENKHDGYMFTRTEHSLRARTPNANVVELRRARANCSNIARGPIVPTPDWPHA